MNQQGNTTTGGTWYINNQTGEFYKFLVYNVLDSTAVIEEDIGSIPEFSPMFPALTAYGGDISSCGISEKENTSSPSIIDRSITWFF